MTMGGGFNHLVPDDGGCGPVVSCGGIACLKKGDWDELEDPKKGGEKLQMRA